MTKPSILKSYICPENPFFVNAVKPRVREAQNNFDQNFLFVIATCPSRTRCFLRLNLRDRITPLRERGDSPANAMPKQSTLHERGAFLANTKAKIPAFTR